MQNNGCFLNSLLEMLSKVRREANKRDEKEWHKHHCEKCDFVWEHTGKMAGNMEAHTCPCGNLVTMRYKGDKAVIFHGCGKPLRTAVEAVKHFAKRVKSLCTVKRRKAA